MLEYVAARRTVGARQSNPSAMLIIISVHVALLALVMSAKMDLPSRIFPHKPTKIDFIPVPMPPPPTGHQASRTPTPVFTTSDQAVKTRPIDPPVSTNPTTSDSDPALSGGGVGGIPTIPQPIITTPIRHDPRLLTPPSELKPPYPADKLLSEEEAVLTLRLTIDEHGRVIDVQPVGRADRSFLEAARRHLMAHWRYRPATDDGRAIASSTVITLRFELDG
jgi:periplasmic protein TonB